MITSAAQTTKMNISSYSSLTHLPAWSRNTAWHPKYLTMNLTRQIKLGLLDHEALTQ